MIERAQNMLSEKIESALFRRRMNKEFCGAFNEMKTLFIHVPKAAGSSVSLSLFGHQVGHASILDYYQKDYGKASRYFKFAFVRDPLDRLYSAYTFLKHGGMNETDAEFSRVHLTDHDFPSFVDRLQSNADLLNWLHFRPQYLFLYDGNHPKNILVNFVGRFESMEQDAAHVAERLGRRWDLPHHNRTVQDEENTLNADSHTRDLVRKIYAEDYEVFGY